MYIDLTTDQVPWQKLYKLGITMVTPRPIAFVSTVSSTGIGNLAPFSFFTMVCANPPILMFCPARTRDADRKDTHVNIEATREFVVAIVTAEMAERMNQTSAPYPPEINEFDEVHFTQQPAAKVRPALVAESPVNCECVLENMIEFSDGPGGGTAVFGKIVAIHIKDDYLANDGYLDPAKLQTIGRMGRTTYCHTTDRFDLARPTL